KRGQAPLCGAPCGPFGQRCLTPFSKQAGNSQGPRPDWMQPMKAEHRKELEKNVLRDRLGKVAEGVKDRSRIIGAVLLGVVVVFLVYMWVSGSSTSKSSALWERLAQTTDARGLEKLAADNRGSLPARTANFE